MPRRGRAPSLSVLSSTLSESECPSLCVGAVLVAPAGSRAAVSLARRLSRTKRAARRSRGISRIRLCPRRAPRAIRRGRRVSSRAFASFGVASYPSSSFSPSPPARLPRHIITPELLLPSSQSSFLPSSETFPVVRASRVPCVLSEKCAKGCVRMCFGEQDMTLLQTLVSCPLILFRKGRASPPNEG